jgi:hypothetical protein
LLRFGVHINARIAVLAKLSSLNLSSSYSLVMSCSVILNLISIFFMHSNAMPGAKQTTKVREAAIDSAR